MMSNCDVVKCVVTTSLLPLVLRHCSASTVNFIWFTDEELFIMSALSNSGGLKSRKPETQPSHKLCVPVHCLAGTCRSPTVSEYKMAITSTEVLLTHLKMRFGGERLGQSAIVIE